MFVAVAYGRGSRVVAAVERVLGLLVAAAAVSRSWVTALGVTSDKEAHLASSVSGLPR